MWAPFVFCNSSLDCILDHERCQIMPSDNVIRTVMGVSIMEKCLELCKAEEHSFGNKDCKAFTHFGAESYPFRNSCILFYTCTKRRPCKGCTTGSSQTECTCSIKYSSVID